MLWSDGYGKESFDELRAGTEPAEVTRGADSRQTITASGGPLSVRGEPLSVRGEPLSVRGEPLSVRGEPLSVRGERAPI